MEDKRKALQQLLSDVCIQNYDRGKFAELTYTASETGLISSDIDLEDVDVILKLLELSEIISDEELKAVRL